MRPHNLLDVPDCVTNWPVQTAIAGALGEMDAAFDVLEPLPDKTRDLEQSMMQELLTGRMRLE